jgi:hypothetical protein
MANAGVTIPNDSINLTSDEKTQIEAIQTMSKKLWGEIPVVENDANFTIEDQRITLAVLNQLTDSLVWWTQRYK